MQITFEGSSAVIAVPDCPEFLEALRGAAFDWPFAEAAGDATAVATVRAAGRGYDIEVSGGEKTVRQATAATAACSVMVEAVTGYINDNPSLLCLHCGSVVINGRLVIFPSRYRAGKSTLVAHLASSGHRVFGDDVLPLEDGDDRGLALGIAPRLRLPLPACASAAFRRFVDEHAGPSDGYYLYLNLPRPILAPRGSTAPLGAVVLLDRRRRGSAVLSETSRSTVLQALIERNFARAAPAGALLERLHGVMDRLPRYTLRYSSLDDASAVLERSFAGWPPNVEPPTTDRASSTPPVASSVNRSDDARPALQVSSAKRLRQNPAVSLRSVDGELFLADAEGLAIHYLNAVGAGLWNLLADPTSADEAFEVLCGAFPDAERAQVRRDVGELFNALAAGGLIILPGEDSKPGTASA